MTLGRWLGLAVLMAALAILWSIRNLVLLVLAAVVLANAINSLAIALQTRLKLKRGGAIALALLILAATGILFFSIVIPPFIDQFSTLIERVPTGIDRLNLWVDRLAAQPLGEQLRQLPELDAASITQQIQPAIERLFRSSFAFFTSTLSGLLNMVLIVIITLMVLVDPQPYEDAFVTVFPAFYRRRVRVILKRCSESLNGWLLGMLLNMVIIAFCSWLGLTILQVDLALAHAMVAGLLNFIPNLGPILSLLPPLLVALIDAPWKCGAVLLLYFIIQQLESTLLTPWVMARQVSLLPALTLIAQVFFATIFGFAGLFLALPLTVMAQVWIQAVLVEDILDRWTVGPRLRFRGGAVAAHHAAVVPLVADSSALPPVPHGETAGGLSGGVAEDSGCPAPDGADGPPGGAPDGSQ